MKLRTVLGLSILLASISGGSLQAQTGQGSLPPELEAKFRRLNIQDISQITPEMLADDHAETYGFEKSSRIYRALVAKFANTRPIDGVDYKRLYNAPVVKQIKGSEGVKIELPQDGKLSSLDNKRLQEDLAAGQPSLEQEEQEPLTSEEQEAIRQEVRKGLTPRRMAACRDSQTKRTAYNEPGIGNSLRELKGLDLLILNSNAPRQSDFLATDFGEIFGKKTTVHHYDSSEPDLMSLRLSISELGCLPVRLRATDRELIVQIGQEALKNHDSERGFQEEFHPVLKGRMEEFLR